MKKYISRPLMLIMSIFMMFLLVSLTAFADDTGTNRNGLEGNNNLLEESDVITSVSLPDSDELFADYMQKQFGIVSQQSSGLRKARRVLQGSKFEEGSPNACAYEAIRNKISLVADGKETSTSFIFSLSELGMKQTYFTAEMLGVNKLSDDQIYVNEEAVQRMLEELNFDISAVMDALMADYPYEFYWFDKVTGYSHSYCAHATDLSFICLPSDYSL